MARPARLAVVFRETIAQGRDRFYSLDEFPCVVRRYFFGDLKVEGDCFHFIVRQIPSDWGALLYYTNGKRVLFLDAFWFEHTLSDEAELEAFLQKVRCALCTGRFIVTFEKQAWRDMKMRCSQDPSDCEYCGGGD